MSELGSKASSNRRLTLCQGFKPSTTTFATSPGKLGERQGARCLVALTANKTSSATIAIVYIHHRGACPVPVGGNRDTDPPNTEISVTSAWNLSSMIFFCIPSSVIGSTLVPLPCKAAGQVSAFFIFWRFTFNSPPSKRTQARRKRLKARGVRHRATKVRSAMQHPHKRCREQSHARRNAMPHSGVRF